jgi:hypothetical protein
MKHNEQEHQLREVMDRLHLSFDKNLGIISIFIYFHGSFQTNK